MRIKGDRFGYPNEAWAREFVMLSVVALRHALISDRIFAERMLFLYSSDLGNIGIVREWSIDDPQLIDWPDNSGCLHIGLENGGRSDLSDGYDPKLSFRMPPRSPLHEWVFNKGDTDPIPSIPHGHRDSSKSKIKLDPYRGFIYEDRTETGERLTLRQCKAFWRSQAFRKMARETMAFALADPRVAAAKHIESRGVTDPFRFPR